MNTDFFPDRGLAWAFVSVLVSVLAASAVHDWRTLRVPNGLSVGLSVLGLIFNVIRGVWLGSQGRDVWQLGANGPVVGALDAVLFGLTGFAVAFAWFFLMWQIGAAGGGDVKLAAAVGAWLGPILFLVALAFSVGFLILLTVGRAFVRLVTGQRVARIGGRRIDTVSEAERRERRMMSYSLPLALGVTLTLFGTFVFELGLMEMPPH